MTTMAVRDQQWPQVTSMERRQLGAKPPHRDCSVASQPPWGLPRASPQTEGLLWCKSYGRRRPKAACTLTTLIVKRLVRQVQLL